MRAAKCRFRAIASRARAVFRQLEGCDASRPLRNIQPAYDRRPRQAAIEPGRDIAEIIERNQFARAVDAEQNCAQRKMAVQMCCLHSDRGNA